jgi:hypothetical protein
MSEVLIILQNIFHSSETSGPESRFQNHMWSSTAMALFRPLLSKMGMRVDSSIYPGNGSVLGIDAMRQVFVRRDEEYA